MSIVDRAINATADMLRASATRQRYHQRRAMLDQQLRLHLAARQQAVHDLGRRVVARAASGAPVPEGVMPAAQEILRWQAEIGGLQQQLSVLERQLMAS